MNIFKDMLYLHGYLIEPRFAEELEPEHYAEGYGNRIASKKAFAPLGRGHARQAPVAAPLGEALCPAGGCA